MSEAMTFPDDWRDFLKSYSFTDSEQIYTNGALLIPVFRVEQLIEHLFEDNGDYKKVIKGLEVCTSNPCYCTDCPYKANCCLDSQEVMKDALALLKEQEERITIMRESREAM